MNTHRRHLLQRLGQGAGSLALVPWLAACGGGSADETGVAEAAADAATATQASPTADGTARTLAAALVTAAPAGRMPDEAEPHAATWMAMGASAAIWGGRLAAQAQQAVARVANAVVDFEPVRLLVRPADLASARSLCDPRVQLLSCALDDLWLRDSGCVFVKPPANTSNTGAGLNAVNFNFNGWGGKQRSSQDNKVAAFMASKTAAPLVSTKLVLEGGSLEVDGHGTALVTESAVLNRNRNPGWTKVAVETELKRLLGLRKIIWLPGIKGRDITDGHIDFYARFVRPGVVVAARDDEPSSYDYAVTRRHLDILRSASDADGRKLQVVELPAPSQVRPAWRSAWNAGEFAAGYVNFYVVNGAVLVPEFGDADADGLAQDRLAALYPGREVVPLNIDAIAAGGGGIHCMTQQQPA